MFATDSSSERATSIEDYQNTCTEFITDISHDYMDWIERYQLGEEETARRKATINHIVKTTNDWIVKDGREHCRISFSIRCPRKQDEALHNSSSRRSRC